jgi:2-methylcitrate dehydratase PrpD
MRTAAPGLSMSIARSVAATRFSDLPQGTVAASKRAILDGIGVMLAASGLSDDAAPFAALARSAGGAPQSTLLGHRDQVAAPLAALANGALAHALDFEDAFDPAPLHPNASLLPAALALAELKQPISGQDFITAVAVGCDLSCRIGLSLRRSLEEGGWYPPPIIGAFGAVTAAAKLLRLDARQILDAFSLLLGQNSCPGEIKRSADTVIRAIREAFPAQATVTSALLAERGVRGFDEPLEGKHGFFNLFAGGKFEPQDLLQGLGERYWIDSLSFKQWPCCRGTHAFIEAAQVLRRQHAFEPDDVERLLLSGGPTQQMLCEPRGQKLEPRTQIDAKFSLPFVTSAALIETEITLGSFSPAHLRDPRVLALAKKTEYHPEPRLAANAAGGVLCIMLKDGRQLQHVVEQAIGDPRRPLSDAALRDKFVDCASRSATPLDSDAAQRLADRIFSLEHEPDAGLVLSARAAYL